MSKQWAPVAHRGELGLTLLTPARAREDGWVPRADYLLVGFIEPDDAEALSIAFRDLALVASFVAEMCPHTLLLVGVEGEDTGEMRDAIAKLGRMDAKHLH
jgi:hypothetical protein